MTKPNQFNGTGIGKQALMNLNYREEDILTVLNDKEELYLAIIHRNRGLLFRKSDTVMVPGHRAWVGRDHLDQAEIEGGFSLGLTRSGVLQIYPQSRLNNDPGLLPRQVLDQLAALFSRFPQIEYVQIYDH